MLSFESVTNPCGCKAKTYKPDSMEIMLLELAQTPFPIHEENNNNQNVYPKITNGFTLIAWIQNSNIKYAQNDGIAIPIENETNNECLRVIH